MMWESCNIHEDIISTLSLGELANIVIFYKDRTKIAYFYSPFFNRDIIDFKRLIL